VPCIRLWCDGTYGEWLLETLTGVAATSRNPANHAIRGSHHESCRSQEIPCQEQRQVRAGPVRGYSRHGQAKSVPASHFEDILTPAPALPASRYGPRHRADGPDYMAVGDLSTLSLVPWQPGYARIVCDGHVPASPGLRRPRHAEKQIAASTSWA